MRQPLARQRHAINLDLPEQEVVADGRRLDAALREPLPVEDCNAEISLLTGMCAARIMLDAGYGILRTVPPPAAGAINALRHASLRRWASPGRTGPRPATSWPR